MEPVQNRNRCLRIRNSEVAIPKQIFISITMKLLWTRNQNLRTRCRSSRKVMNSIATYLEKNLKTSVSRSIRGANRILLREEDLKVKNFFSVT